MLDSSPQYLSNVFFTTSLAFQMTEEYIFEEEEKIVFENFDLKGAK